MLHQHAVLDLASGSVIPNIYGGYNFLCEPSCQASTLVPTLLVAPSLSRRNSVLSLSLSLLVVISYRIPYIAVTMSSPLNPLSIEDTPGA